MKKLNKKNEIRAIVIFVSMSLLLLLSVNIASLYSITRLHNVANTLYNHPLQVSNAALLIQKNILEIHKNMQKVLHAKNKKEFHKLLHKADIYEQNVYINLNIIKKNILGAKGLVLENNTRELFKEWKGIHEKVISFIEKREFQKAINIARTEGATHVEKLERSTDILYKYAHTKANNLHQYSNTTFENFKIINIILSLSTLVLFLLFFLYIKKRVNNYFTFIRKNEKSLQELNKRYTLAIEGTNDGLWDWNVKDGTIYFSPRWKEMLGYKDDELANNFETWESRVHPDDLAHANEEIEKAHANPHYEYRTIHRLRHKNGSWVWILDRGKTIFDKNGKAVRMVGFHTDITKEKELEEELRESNETFELFMENTPAKVYISENGVTLYANKNAKDFFQDNTIVGKKISDTISPEVYEQVQKSIDKVFEIGAHDTVAEVKNAAGELRVNHQYYFVMDDKKKKIGLISMDITKEKHQEEELHKKDEIMIAQSRHAAMGEMISMIAHQWRQPISVIAMDANNVLADIELDMLDTTELLETSKDIVYQTQELSKTIDDFKEFFKPNKTADEVKLKAIFDDALAIIGKSLENNDVNLLLNIDASLSIRTYSRELMQVLINIIKNAKEALVEKNISNRQIQITSSCMQESVLITICDNAGGVSTAIMDEIFNPYFTTKDEKNGTGLGLYMSKTIIEKHLGGSIKVFNKNDGACFEIGLPLC